MGAGLFLAPRVHGVGPHRLLQWIAQPGGLNSRKASARSPACWKAKSNVRAGLAPSASCEGGSIPCPSSGFFWVAGSRGLSLVHRGITLISAFICLRCSLCACLHVHISSFSENVRHAGRGPTQMAPSSLDHLQRARFQIMSHSQYWLVKL